MDVLKKVAHQLGLTRQDAHKILSEMFSQLGISSFEEEDQGVLYDVLSAHLSFMKNIKPRKILAFRGNLTSYYISEKETENIYLFPTLSVCPICEKELNFDYDLFSLPGQSKIWCQSAHVSFLPPEEEDPESECNFELLGYFQLIAVVSHTPHIRLVNPEDRKAYESDLNKVFCYHLRHLILLEVPDLKFSDEINRLSPNFPRLYSESLKAELHGFEEVAGGGYRKALEFLIKDFCISLHPDQEEEIKSKPLAKCIEEYVQDINIREAAKRAAWLGNDQLHYLRRWTDKDIDDLKKLIAHTVRSIEHHLETLKIIQTMPEHKRS